MSGTLITTIDGNTAVSPYTGEQASTAVAAAVIATAADRVQTGLDRIATAADAVSTAADVVSTAADLVATTAAKDAAVAALAAGNVYTDTTIAAAIVTGLAAVAEGETFYATGDDVTYIGLYRDDSGVATEITRIATATAVDEAVAAAEAATANSATSPTQIVCVNGTPVVGLSTSAGTYTFDEPVVADGFVYQIRFYTGATGTFKFFVADRDGDVFTRVAASEVSAVVTVAGLQTVAVNIPFKKGQLLGVYNPNTNRLHRTTSIPTATPYYYIAGDTSSYTSATAATSVRLEIGFDCRLAATAKEITISNSSRINVFGDSHSEMDYAPRGKSWLFNSSAMTDLVFENFAKSGDTMAENITRAFSGTKTLGKSKISERAASYAAFYIGQNDTAVATVEEFREDVRQGVEMARGMGMTPIIIAQHRPGVGGVAEHYGVGYSNLYRAMAQEFGGHFINVSANSIVVDNGARYAGFWNATHPAHRTSHIISDPVTDYLQKHLVAEQSIKVFRVRSGVSPAAAADLLFDDHYSRDGLFKEALFGTAALKVADEGLNDVANTVISSNFELLDSEYIAMSRGAGIAVTDDYWLVEVTLPALNQHIDLIGLTFVDTGLTVYARDSLGGTDPNPAWSALDGANGFYQLTGTRKRRLVRSDKLSLLIFKSGGTTDFVPPKVQVIGNLTPKPRPLPLPAPVRGAELLTYTDLGSLTGWTTAGTVTTGLPPDAASTADMPKGSTGRVTLTSADSVAQAFTVSADTRAEQEVEVTVTARCFPTIGALGPDDFDRTKVRIVFTTSGGDWPIELPTALWWKDVKARFSVPIGATGATVKVTGVSGELDAEVCRVSVRSVN